MAKSRRNRDGRVPLLWKLYRETYAVRGPDGTPRLDAAGQQIRRPLKKYYSLYRDLLGRVRKVPLSKNQEASEHAIEGLRYLLTRAAAHLPIDRRDVPPLVEKEFDRALKDSHHRWAQARARPIGEDLDDYEAHLRGDVSPAHLLATMRRLRACVQACAFERLADVAAAPVKRYLLELVGRRDKRAPEGRSPRTYNVHLSSVRAFVNWCLANERLERDPLRQLAKRNEAEDVRRARRALTDDELGRLLYVAKLRPLAERGRETVRKDRPDDAAAAPGSSDAPAAGEAKPTRRGRWGWVPLTYDTIDAAAARAREDLKPEQVAELERVGRERVLIYSTLVHTGLRRGELLSLRWASIDDVHGKGWLSIAAADAKNRKAERLPLREDLFRELLAWRAECGNPPASARVFHVGRDLVVVLKRDLKVAGIEFIDPRGRRLDVHALRHTTGTNLAKRGVAPRTAQALMRHSKIELTMRTYTDDSQLPLRDALAALPVLTAAAPGKSFQRATAQAGGPSGAARDVAPAASEPRPDLDAIAERLAAAIAEDLADGGADGFEIPRSQTRQLGGVSADASGRVGEIPDAQGRQRDGGGSTGSRTAATLEKLDASGRAAVVSGRLGVQRAKGLEPSTSSLEAYTALISRRVQAAAIADRQISTYPNPSFLNLTSRAAGLRVPELMELHGAIARLSAGELGELDAKVTARLGFAWRPAVLNES